MFLLCCIHFRVAFVKSITLINVILYYLQATTSSDEVVSLLPPADPSQCPDLPAMQGQESISQSEKAQEEGAVRKSVFFLERPSM